MISMVLVVFPILIYLVFSCYNSINDKKTEKLIFLITILTSLYLSLMYDLDDHHVLILCNIPILICYFKKDGLLGVILSLLASLISYYKYDINIYLNILKYCLYLITYLCLYKKKEFNYLFLKISATIQGLFLSFEYFIRVTNISNIFKLFSYILIVYALTFACLYLLKLANNIRELYVMVNDFNKENKLKDALFKLTHEIKNPLAVCKGYLSMINLNNKEKSERYLSIVKSEIERSLNVIKDFTEYSKIRIKKEIFDIMLLLTEVYNSFLLLLKDKKINFNFNVSDEEIYLLGDYERLKQVFVNIIKNSIESITNNGIIDMNIMINKKEVIITISDNGIGMTNEELKNMKKMFYTTKNNGTGLGVALSNEIVVAHNGKMVYESIKNVGTKCIITLPIEE